MIAQPCFPGFEAFFRPVWQPNPHTLARVKNYLEGFAAHGREIRWKLRTAAGRLEMGRSTLCRYLRWLRDENWLATVKKTMRYAIRKVLATVKLESSSGTPCGTPIEVKPEASQNPLKQNTTNAPSSGGKQAQGVPLGYGQQFAEYVTVFDRALKPRNHVDLARAHCAWIGIGPQQWEPALTDARRIAREVRSPRFMPSMVNHLLDQPWTRVVVASAPANTCDNGWAWNDPRWSDLGD